MSTFKFRYLFHLAACLAVFSFAAPCGAAQSGLRAARLMCEHRVEPTGIDEKVPELSWIVESGERGSRQTAYQVMVAGSKTALDSGAGDIFWDSGRVESDETSHIEYNGAPLGSGRPYFWKVRVWDEKGEVSDWSAPASWSMGLLNESDWSAKWIGLNNYMSKKQKMEAEMMRIKSPLGKKTYFPATHLRKDFTARGGVRRATAYATALGFFELYVNGRRIGNDYFTPGWTDYNKRVYYLTYDVTNMINSGAANAVGAILADGWYAGNVGFVGQNIYGSQLRLMAQIVVEYEDGSSQLIGTDETWRATDGPIREADMQAGETYDARLEMPGWNSPGFDDSKWKRVELTDRVGAKVEAYPGIPVRKVMEIKPLTMTEPKPGVFVFNLGQNFAGCARLKVRGKAGDKVVLRFAEMLNADGTIYTENLRGARVIDTYILKGDGEEIWEPSFTFHGFQYVEITGYPGRPTLDSVTGIVMRSDLRETSSLETSDPLVNKLYSNLFWGQRSNYLEVPTDCPQRDERLGWMGDAQVFVRTAAYNMDIEPFFKKWMVDVEDAQRENGGYTDVSPAIIDVVSAAWGDAGVIIPWTLHKVYGDTRIIKKHYASMSKWADFLIGRSMGNLAPSLGSYGDWLNVKQPTDNGLISSAYYARSLELMADMAKTIGKTDDEEKYRKYLSRARKAFAAFYVSSDGTVAGDSQTGYLLALRFGLLPEKLRPLAAAKLVENIKNRDWSLATGFVGGGLLLPTLTDIGRTDVAYRLLLNRKYPSWGYSIDQGATTIWERWNSYTIADGFGDPGMNSFNHYAYGSVGEWMFGVMAGIDTDGPGYKRIAIRPIPGGGLTFARASYDSPRGEISTHWRFDGDAIILDVTIPANTSATVYIPALSETDVTESGKQVAESAGVRYIKMEGRSAAFEIQSGKYSFRSESGKTAAGL